MGVGRMRASPPVYIPVDTYSLLPQSKEKWMPVPQRA